MANSTVNTARLPASCLRVLAVVMEDHRRGTNPSHREICERLGWSTKSINAVQNAVARLRAAGLVTWDDGLMRTLRPTCRYERAP